MKKITKETLRKAGRWGVVASAVLLVAGFYVAGTVQAETGGANMQFSVNVQSLATLSVSIGGITGNQTSIDITPSYAGGVFRDSDDVTVSVSTNNRTGYHLVMTSTTGSLNDTSGHMIRGLETTAATGNDFPANTWGYAQQTSGSYGSYNGIGNGVEIDSDTVPVVNKVSTLKFGAKVDSSLPAGSYTTTIVFTATTNPSLVMQNVDAWKDSLAVGESAQAIDDRDQNVYWVTRIATDPAIPDALPGGAAGSRADCTTTGGVTTCSQLWMTQNLDLDLTSGNDTFTHLNTDLGYTSNNANATWRPETATISGVANIDDFTVEYADERSYDFGDTYYYTSGSTGNESAQTLAQCSAAHSEAECAHYHAGNLYNFYAAAALRADDTAATPTSNYSYMPNSICPAGWRLPVGNTSLGATTDTPPADNSNWSDFGYLLLHNGVTPSSPLPDAGSANGSTSPYGNDGKNVGYATDGFTKLRTSPLWFVRSGNAWSGSLNFQGVRAYYWSGSVFSSTVAYSLDLYSGVIRPANNGNRANGFSVRCVAR